MRRLHVVLGVAVLVLGAAAPAAAHHLVVSPPGGGNGPPPMHWVGGTVSQQAQGVGLIVNPFGDILSASHGAGLVQACEAAKANGSSVVSFVPPPSLFPGAPADTDCQHGEPPGP